MGYDGQYETVTAVNNARRGPLRFEEGVATDTDVPNDFGRGAYSDTQGDGRGRPSMSCQVKPAAETQKERAHVGSASWIEAPTMLSDFVIGAQANGPGFETEMGSERRLRRLSPATVSD